MSRNLVVSVATVLFLLLGVTRYLSHLPHIFDVALDDELVYMGVGTDFDHLILWPPSFQGIYSSYENGGFYSGIYGALSEFFSDPIDLYIYGGMAIVVSAVLFGFISSLLLSDSFIVATAITCPVVLSGELLTWPRVSFGAIAVIALGFAVMARVSVVPDQSRVAAVRRLPCSIYPAGVRAVVLYSPGATTRHPRRIAAPTPPDGKGFSSSHLTGIGSRRRGFGFYRSHVLHLVVSRASGRRAGICCVRRSLRHAVRDSTQAGHRCLDRLASRDHRSVSGRSYRI